MQVVEILVPAPRFERGTYGRSSTRYLKQPEKTHQDSMLGPNLAQLNFSYRDGP